MQVSWARRGPGSQIDLEKIRVELRAGERHVLLLDSPSQADLGQYVCTATNSINSSQAAITIQGRTVNEKP